MGMANRRGGIADGGFEEFIKVMGVILIGGPLLLFFLMYLLVNPGFGVFALTLISVGGLINLGKARICRGN